jgi:hypothetical protein
MRVWESHSAREVRELAWTEDLARLLRTVSPAERADHRQSAPWKIRLAVAMKSSTDVANPWLASQLHMGSAAYLSKLVSLALRHGAR